MLPPGATSNCRIVKLGAPSSGPIRHRMRQPLAPSILTSSSGICSKCADFHERKRLAGLKDQFRLNYTLTLRNRVNRGATEPMAE